MKKKLNIREINRNDLAEIELLLGKSMPQDYFNEKLIEENIIKDENFEPGLTLVAEDKNNKIVGFVMGLIRKREEGNMGYIKFLAVLPEWRLKGIGSGLYLTIEKKLQLKAITKVRLCESYPNYFIPGIDPFYTDAVCFFERYGYIKFDDTSNLICDLENQSFETTKLEEKILQKGIKIYRASTKDFNRIISWLENNFKAWIKEVKSAFKNNPVSLHIAEKDDKIIAFSAYETNNKSTGWFGPMGTNKAARGLGIGGVLLKRCMADMKKQGFKKSIIPWVGPIPFYMHYVKSPVSRVFWRYEKILK